MKLFLLGFVAAFVLLPAFALAYFRLGLAETPSDATPPAWETLVMQLAVHASVHRSAAGLQAPPPGNVDDAVVEGGTLYLNGCAGCHGTPGKPAEDAGSYPPIPQPNGRHSILATGNVLDHQTRHKKYRHVRLRPVLFR